MNYIGQQAMWLPYNAFKRIADTLQVTCKPHATVTKRVVIWSASYSASHFVRKDHMTHMYFKSSSTFNGAYLSSPSIICPSVSCTGVAHRTGHPDGLSLETRAREDEYLDAVTRDGHQQCC